MTWIWTTVKVVHLTVLLLVCGIGFYNLSVASQKLPPSADKKDGNLGALSVVPENDEQKEAGIDDITVEDVDEIVIENPEPFIPTNEWQTVKPGQAIPRGLHVRLNVQTGIKEARLMQEEAAGKEAPVENNEGSSDSVTDKISLDELKKAVKSMKSEGFKSVDMETLQKKHQFRSYEELKADMEAIDADIKTDAEIVSELVERFQTAVKTQGNEDLSPVLEELELYLHQIDNAMLFCDLGAMPVLLHCLNSSTERVRSEAALVLGSALQNNPKVQISALENGAMQAVLRLIAFDPSPMVRKRGVFALSSFLQHFPYAQKRFLQLGGLLVLGKLFDNSTSENLRVRAVTLLADLIREKELHSVHSAEDSSHEERLRQYGEINLQEAMVESGWCSLIPSLLVIPEHDSREKVLTAMETFMPACRVSWESLVPALRNLGQEYRDLITEEEKQSSGLEDDDGYFQDLVIRIEALLDKLYIREEL